MDPKSLGRGIQFSRDREFSYLTLVVAWMLRLIHHSRTITVRHQIRSGGRRGPDEE